MGVGGGGSSSQTTQTTPWAAQQPFLESGFASAKNLYDQGPPQFFPGQTFVNQDPATSAGLTAEQQRAQSGSSVTGAADNFATNVLSGNSGNPYAPLLGVGAGSLAQTASGANVGGNPFLDATFNAAARPITQNFQNTVLPGIAAQFGANGRTGSAGQALALGDASGKFTDSLSGLGAQIYGTNYQQERDRQLQAAQGLTSTGANLYNTGAQQQTATLGLAPQTANQDYVDPAKLQEVGAANETQAGKALQDQIARFNYGQTAPLSSLQDYMSLISGNYGSTSTSQGRTSTAGNPLATGLGAVTTLGSLTGGK